MRALLLDRDGVINRDSPHYIRSADDWQALPGSLEAIARAQHAGYHVIVVSNQSGLARGYFDMHALNGIHLRLQRELEQLGARIEAFFFCPHGPDEGCDCRKPRGGLIETLAARLGLDRPSTPFIGDRLSDARAGLAAGVRPLLVRSGLEPVTAEAARALGDVPVYADLAAAVEDVLCS
ncbi:MAG: D-glycero-beta-D-manno-heptose 1,7-bisphosphate 7-phosphatase [Gammaproteobacteria bacterium]|nr:D-glycero-beta-D-manno-heptose 1,7-bisphosphate 7-phosphatase [Gammaproteobacteria bacterium]MCP5201720.1 D-glycero-beta-D-manno-heptose 1,7-bisphosphate 7-phosphatase [Gammaproteobacteria bacterium]